MSNLGKCISCGKTIDKTHDYCMYCGVRQIKYINYFGGIKIKRKTTTLIGFLSVTVALLIGGYFFFRSHATKVVTNSTISMPSVVDKTKDSTYLIKDSDKYPITQDNLKGFTKAKLAMARNEILARHGLVYRSEPYKSYFDSKSWYKANPNFKGQKMDLSPLERHNIKIIMAAEGTKPEANYDSDYHGK